MNETRQDLVIARDRAKEAWDAALRAEQSAYRAFLDAQKDLRGFEQERQWPKVVAQRVAEAAALAAKTTRRRKRPFDPPEIQLG